MNKLAVTACYQSPPFITEYCDRRDIISIVISLSFCHFSSKECVEKSPAWDDHKELLITAYCTFLFSLMKRGETLCHTTPSCTSHGTFNITHIHLKCLHWVRRHLFSRAPVIIKNCFFFSFVPSNFVCERERMRSAQLGKIDSESEKEKQTDRKRERERESHDCIIWHQKPDTV